jgi:hypothetical protein
MYPELVYFDGAHFAHIVAFQERNRLADCLRAPSRLGRPPSRSPARRLARSSSGHIGAGSSYGFGRG